MHLNSLAIAVCILKITTVIACDSSETEQDKLKISFILNPSYHHEERQCRATSIAPTVTTAFETTADFLYQSEEQTQISHKKTREATPPSPKSARLENAQLFGSGIICPSLLDNQPLLELQLQPAMSSATSFINLHESIQEVADYHPQLSTEQTKLTQKLLKWKTQNEVTLRQFTQKYHVTLEELRKKFSSVACVHSIPADTVRAVLYLMSQGIKQKQISEEFHICKDHLSNIRHAQDETAYKIKRIHQPSRESVHQKIEQYIRSNNLDKETLKEQFSTIPPHTTRLSDDGMRIIALLKQQGHAGNEISRMLGVGRRIIHNAIKAIESTP